MAARVHRLGWTSALLAVAACRAAPSSDQLVELARRSESAVPPPKIDSSHKGPFVAVGTSGPARFARLVFEEFEPERALATATFLDQFYREPGNAGFDACLDHVARQLADAGFGTDPRFTVEVRESVLEGLAWTPLRAKLEILATDGGREVLHELRDPKDPDRTMLPRNAPSADVEGDACTKLDDVRAGSVWVTESPLDRKSLERARELGAVAALSASLEKYNVDPTGGERHLDAIQYRGVPHPCPLPVAQISPRSYRRIAQAIELHGRARIAYHAEVRFDERPLRTLIATVVGATHPEEAVVVAAHVQEPGACDNASGVATVLESVRATVELIQGGRIEPPARSLVFLWGAEIRQSRLWLEWAERTTVCAISADMTGESQTATGAIQLLERAPDPGSVRALPPDEHTAWGTGEVDPARIQPSGLAIIARTAITDVGVLTPQWPSAEHPFEGGSDHHVFLDADVPAVLFWHFPDFAYHTSLDRMAHVDAEEMRRSGAAILATALAIADPRPTDLTRYLASLRWELELRLAACAFAGDEPLAERWRAWCVGARQWLRAQCLGIRGAPSATLEEGNGSR